MVSQADRELISNFVAELRPYLETVAAGVQEFAQPNRDGVVVGQAVQALVMIRGAGQILMVDGLVSIASWLTEAFELVQSNPDLSPAEAARRLGGLSSAMEDYLRALDRGEDVDPIVLRARTIYEAIPAFSGPLPGTGRFRSRTDLDALFGDDESTAPTDRITPPEAIDTERLRPEPVTFDAYGQTPDAMPTVPLQHLPPAQPEAQPATPPEALPTVPLGQQGQGAQGVADGPARIVPIPPQPTEKLPEVDPELREIFEDEALEIIGTFGDNIRILAGKPDDFEAISRLNRAAHTLKGAANMTGFPVVGQIGAAIERLMDEHIERHKPITRDALELVAVSWKMLRAMMPHLNDLSSFTSPSNSVVQRANVLRERLASEDAEAETLSIGSQRIARPPAGEERAPEAPEPQDEIVAVSARPTDEDTAQIKADEVTPEPAAVAQDVVIDVEVADSEHVAEPETLAEPEHFAEPEAPAEVEETQDEAAPVPEVVAVDAPPAEEPVAMEEDVVEAEQPFWEAAAETEPEASDERPQSEPFWTPGTEELLRTALKTDQLVAELHGITGTMSDLDTDIDEPEPEHFAAPETGAEPDEAPTQDTGEWLIEEGERPATDLLNFDERPQTEPFWGNLDAELPALEPLDIDEPVTMDP
ncbi:MAG TPA: Hpt domain-containing protein, partial [Thermomicrobiales bacterium]|nr:Hpt domain-containing protein [Thermomicrobiales bacterium]